MSSPVFPCYSCERPPIVASDLDDNFADIVLHGHSVSVSDPLGAFTTAAAALASAVSRAVDPLVAGASGALLRKEVSHGTTWGATYQSCTYRLIYYTPTCYIKIWWDEITRISTDGVITYSRVQKTFEWTATDTADCINPNGTIGSGEASFNPGNIPKNTVEITPDDPGFPSSYTNSAGIITSVTNIRFSFLPAYSPGAAGENLPDITGADVAPAFLGQGFPPATGCCDPGASNYDYSAIICDGSCIYDPP